MTYDDLSDSETHDDPREGFTDEEWRSSEENPFNDLRSDLERGTATIENGHIVTDGWHCFLHERPPEGVPLLLCAPPDKPEQAVATFHAEGTGWYFVGHSASGRNYHCLEHPEVFFWKVVSPMPDGVLFRLASSVNRSKVTT